MVIVFVLVALAVLALVAALHWYVWRRLVRDATRGPGPARRVGTGVFVAGPTLMITALVAERSGAPFWLQRTLAWPGFLWMALSLYLLLAVVAGEAVRPLLRRLVAGRAPARTATLTPPDTVTAEEREPETASVSLAAEGAAAPVEVNPPPASGPPAAGPGPKASAPGVPDPARRLFVSRVVAGAAATAAVATVGYGTYGVLRGPNVKRVTVPLARLPRSAHGFRIAVVSDIHLGPVLGRGFAQKVVDTVNATQPDLIAVVGDLVDGSVKDLGPAAAPLAGLRARHGAYFVTGNHEYFSGAEQWVEEVRRLGLRPLENARTELPAFDLAGVNDIQGESEGRGPDFGKALGDRDTARACVLLAHQPVQVHEAVRHGVDLQLSGHTHGGQLWPGNLVAAAANPTVAGLERYGDTQLYVSRGAGAWGPPTRVGAPSDITVIELASRDA
ncbi:metallophosphoesterase [Streptomyces sp. NPDC058964]|uniref:metallophosphoesterase n=1 Tax=Streptomyces sp. NPDC058964 TaxID=3346681 RepID=UPI003697C251